MSEREFLEHDPNKLPFRGGQPTLDKLNNYYLKDIKESLKKAVRELRNNNASTFGDGHYHAVVHPDLEKDLYGLSPYQRTIDEAIDEAIEKIRQKDEMELAVDKWNKYYNG